MEREVLHDPPFSNGAINCLLEDYVAFILTSRRWKVTNSSFSHRVCRWKHAAVEIGFNYPRPERHLQNIENDDNLNKWRRSWFCCLWEGWFVFYKKKKADILVAITSPSTLAHFLISSFSDIIQMCYARSLQESVEKSKTEELMSKLSLLESSLFLCL